MKKGKKSKLLRYLKEDRELIFMCLPAVIKIFIFSYLPMIGILIAFEDYIPAKGIFGSPFVGFKNFEFFFKSQSAFVTLRNTIVMNVLNMILSTIVNVLFALLLYEISRRILLKI